MTSAARFAVAGEARPDTLLRTLNVLAQLGLTRLALAWLAVAYGETLHLNERLTSI